MKQEPFTTYRPVYKTETYRVPVTYTTPAPAAPACNTCALPVMQQAPMIQAPVGIVYPNQYYQAAPNTGATYQAAPTYGAPTSAADTQPSLNPQNLQKPAIRSRTVWPDDPVTSSTTNTDNTGYRPLQDPNPSARWNNNSAPQLLNPFNQTTNAPSVERWNYSPVKLASYESPLKVPAALQRIERQAAPTEYVGSISPESAQSNWQTSPTQTRTDNRPGQRVNEGWRKD